MAIETICGSCGKKLSVADENVGRQARCPACGHIYTVPNIASAQTQAPLGDNGPSLSGSGTEPLEVDGTDSDTSQYWMLAVDGTQYGPVGRQTLDRWFLEGRVGPGYQLKRGETGSWQSPDYFRPTARMAAGNPYSNNPFQPTDSQQGMFRYPKSDQGSIVLAMGILGFFMCPIFGIVAWVMGHTALKDIQAGRADPRGKTLVQVGYYMGIASVIINILCISGYFVIVAVAIVGGGM